MSLIDRIRGAAQPPATALLPEQERAELDAAIDAFARRRLAEALAEIDATLAYLRTHRSITEVADRLLDTRNRLTSALPAPAEATS